MKKLTSLFTSVTAILLLLSTTSSHALGRTRTNNQPGATGFEEILRTLSLNPYVVTLQAEFKHAKKPIVIPDATLATIDDTAILMGVRYECRVFNALSKADAMTPAEGRSFYVFQRFGSLFIDNMAYMEGARIKSYAPHPGLEHEVWGQSYDKGYFEAIRVMNNGDLVIEGFAAEDMWAKSALGFLGITFFSKEFMAKLQGLGIPSIVGGEHGFITSYAYCPRPARL